MNVTMISIDPGVLCNGVALWRALPETPEHLQLDSAFLVQGESWHDTAKRTRDRLLHLYGAATVVIERPQIYVQSKQRGDPNDLVTVALVAGAVTVDGGGVITYLPREWKGSTPKEVMVDRIRRQLVPYETDRVVLPTAKRLQHNVWDAIGLGLHHAKRMRKGKS